MSIIACSVDECEKKVLARGWCSPHYRLWMRTGSTETTRFTKKECSVGSCPEVVKARSWCAAHYARWQKSGTVGSADTRKWKAPVVDGSKLCGDCAHWKPLADYNANSHKTGPKSMCRECERARNAAWREANPTYWQEWQKANPQETRDIANRRRAKKVSGEYEKIDRDTVFERDNFECHICTEPIDMDAKFPHPLSPTLDHVIPLNKGGGHLYSNLAAAHFRCNVIKGDRLPA